MPLIDTAIIHILIALALLFTGIRASHLACRFLNIPLVIGELVAGILLGPSLLGVILPGASQLVFPVGGIEQVVFKQIDSYAVLLLLFSAGLEMEWAFVKSNLKQVAFTSMGSALLPFVTGVAFFSVFPSLVQGHSEHPVILSVFFGIAMAISALPVIIRILGDFNLVGTKIGSITIATASVMDLVCWAAFTGLLGIINQSQALVLSLPIRLAILLIVLLGGFIILPKVLNPLFGYLKDKKYGVLFLVLICFLLCISGAMFTDAMGVHAGFGGLMAGVLVGNLSAAPENVRAVLLKTSQVLSPIFFINIGGHLNFIENFSLPLLLVILAVSIPSKIIGSYFGGLFGGLKAPESLIIGVLLNARGAMEIILVKQALESGLINNQLFIALAAMAILTSLLSSYGAKCLMSLQNPKREPQCILS